MSDLTDHDEAAIRAIGLGPDNAGQDHPKWDGGWIPIETAPRDQRLLVWNGFEMFCAHWAEKMETGDVAWIIAEYSDGLQILTRPTHWMPLPKPPKEAK